jgi:hypothetical protein
VVQLSVAVADTAGAELAPCGRRVFLPGITDDLRCSLSLPDSLHYDPATDSYAPDPFTATLMLANVLDSSQGLIEVQLDLSSAPHLAADSGEDTHRMIDAIPAHEPVAVTWRLAVAGRSDSPIVEPVSAWYRHANDSIWRSCARDLHIGGGRRAAASCSSAGHDSLWADVAYEDIIPHPVQLQYTMMNTGTLPLSGCSVAVLQPPMLRLVVPADSIQDFGTIAPGARVSREWLFAVDAGQASEGDIPVFWRWRCDSLSGDTACVRHVTLRIAPPRGIVLSPWLLRFAAAGNGALPAAQTVTVWTGGALAMPWRLETSATWLDAQPTTGAAMQSVAVRPNTTDRADGLYAAVIDVVSAAMAAPPRVQVFYDIATADAASDAPAPPAGVALDAPYPNPTPGATSLAFTLGAAGAARLVVYDIHGRRVATAADGSFAPGRHVVRSDLSLLPAGVYLCVLHAGDGTRAMRRVVLRK